MVRMAINGFGRIGRLAFRAALTQYRDDVRVVAVNTSGGMDIAGWAQLVKHDSTFGPFAREMTWDESDLLVEDERIAVLAQREPAKIPWNRYGVDVVIESTGVFRTLEEAGRHLNSGAKRVIISANPKGEGIPTFIRGVNLEKYKQEKIISCGSCTTNCVTPICKVLLDNFVLEKGELTTVHAVTSDQRLLDGSHQDLRRARTALNNIVPTSSGAAEAVVEVFPKLKGKFSARALRVPVISGSFSDLTFVVKKKTTAEAVNALFKKAAAEELAGVMAYSEEPLVSSDVLGDPHSVVIDGLLTEVVDGTLVKIGAWYDNEWGYSCRLIEEVAYIGQHAA